MFAKTSLSSHFGIHLTGLEGTAVQARAVFFVGMRTRCSKPMWSQLSQVTTAVANIHKVVQDFWSTKECDVYGTSVYIQPDVARTWQTEGDCYQQTLNTAQIRQAVAWWRVRAPEVVSSGLIHALHFTFYLVRCVEVKRSSAICVDASSSKKVHHVYTYIYIEIRLHWVKPTNSSISRITCKAAAQLAAGAGAHLPEVSLPYLGEICGTPWIKSLGEALRGGVSACVQFDSPIDFWYYDLS